MTQTREERLAYRRGYHRGHMRMYEHVRKLLTVAQGLRARLTDPASTMPRCDGCARWKRGGDLTHWGVCAASFEYGVEPRMWAETEAALATPEIVTSEDFGCVGWLPVSAPARGGPGRAAGSPGTGSR